MSKRSTTVRVLNQLIQIHHDRIAGYMLALRMLKDKDDQLAQQFEVCCNNSRQYIAQLTEQVWQNKGKIENSPSVAGKLFRVWMMLRCSLSHSKNSIISLCLWGEYALQKAYETAQYRDDEITSDAARLINTQYAILRRYYHEQKEHHHLPALIG